MSERKKLVQYIQRVSQQGWFRQHFTEISWTDRGVVMNGTTYTTLHELRLALINTKNGEYGKDTIQGG